MGHLYHGYVSHNQRVLYINTYWIAQFITFFIISFSMSKISKLLSPQEWICSNKASPRTPVRNGAGFCIIHRGGVPRFPTSHAGIPIAGWFHGKSPKINGWILEKWWMVSICTGSWWSYLLFWRILDLPTTWFSNHESVMLVTPGLASNLLMVGFFKPHCW